MYFLNHLYLVIFLVGALTLSSCQKDLDINSVMDDSLTPRDGDSDTLTVLGAVKQNPFSVSKIVAAKTALYGGLATSTITTHRYVRFRPTNADQVILISSMSYPVFDFPLDREIVSIGNDLYANPDVATGSLPYYYSTVPIDSILPDGVPTDILDILSYRLGDTTIVKKSYELAGYGINSQEYKDYSAMIKEQGFINEFLTGDGTGNGGGPPPPITSSSPSSLVMPANCSCHNGASSRNFAGCIKVYDTQLNQDVAARRLHMIAIGPFGLWVQTDTDDGGCFYKMGTRLWGPCYGFIEVKNERAKIFDGQGSQIVGSLLVGAYLVPHRYYFKKFNGNSANTSNWTFEVGEDDTKRQNAIWKSLTINNAVQEMHDFCNSTTYAGILAPPANLKILSHNFSNNAAAPMLKKIGNHYGITTLNYSYIPFKSLIGEIWNVNVSLTLIETLLSSLIPVMALIAPDVVIGCNSETNSGINYMLSDQLKQLTYHELAHTIHWRTVTDLYWIDEVNYTIENNGYGDGTANGAGRAAIVEAWAYFMGPTIANAAYGINGSTFRMQYNSTFDSGGGESSFHKGLERFNPEKFGDERRWIPKGVMHDLRDDMDFNEILGANTDLVFGYTILQLLAALQNDVVNPIDFRNRLLQQNANYQQAQVNTLFSAYGYQ